MTTAVPWTPPTIGTVEVGDRSVSIVFGDATIAIEREGADAAVRVDDAPIGEIRPDGWERVFHDESAGAWGARATHQEKIGGCGAGAVAVLLADGRLLRFAPRSDGAAGWSIDRPDVGAPLWWITPRTGGGFEVCAHPAGEVYGIGVALWALVGDALFAAVRGREGEVRGE